MDKWTNSLSNLVKAIQTREKWNCLMECNKMSNCKSASFSSLDSTCSLYDKSQLDAAAVKVPLTGRNLYFKKSKSPTDVVFTELKLIVSFKWHLMEIHALLQIVTRVLVYCVLRMFANVGI